MTSRIGSSMQAADDSRQGSSSTGSLFSTLAYPFIACVAASRGRTRGDESASLLDRDDASGSNAYEDSDAISLLSNIQDRSRRRNRRRNRRSVADLGCGLFGRTQGQIEAQEQAAANQRRSASARARRSQQQSLLHESEDEEDDPRLLPRSDSAASIESGGAASFGMGQESGDEDAGMLGDADIAELSHSRELEAETASDSQQDAADIAKRKQRLQEEAERYAQEQAELATKHRKEEEELAAKEEAEAKKALGREDLSEDVHHSDQVEWQRRQTEADAEAAAGGFDFADFPSDGAHGDHGDYQDQGYVGDYDVKQASQMNDTTSPQHGVVIHHHYYHEPEQPAHDYFDEGHSHEPQALFTGHTAEHENEDHGEDSKVVQEENEDDADIAGLSFSKNRAKRAGTSGTGSGSESRQTGTSGQRSSNLRRTNLSPSQSAQLGPTSPVRSSSYRERTEAGNSSASGSANGIDRKREHPRRKQAQGQNEVDDTTVRPHHQAPTDDTRANAAAGGFDEYERSMPIFSPTSPRSSATSQERSARRREQPRSNKSSSFSSAGLNAPRNPMGANPFT